MSTLITIRSDTSKVVISSYGASLINWWYGTKNPVDVVVGEHKEKSPYFNCICGRVANRIENSSFYLDDTSTKCELSMNHGDHHLHGGNKGLSFVEWNVTKEESNVAELSFTSMDGEEGYPGTVEFLVTYSLNDSTLTVEYEARVKESDLSTPINPTIHTYFNLNSNSTDDIREHYIQTDCKYYIETDSNLIPTGTIRKISDFTPLDFSKPKKIGKDIDQLISNGPKGYDHFFLFDKNKIEQQSNSNIRKLLSLTEQYSGLTLNVYSTSPGFQLYTGNYLGGIDTKGKVLRDYGGVAIETHCLPNAVNRKEWRESVMYDRNKVYRQVTKYELFQLPMNQF